MQIQHILCRSSTAKRIGFQPVDGAAFENWSIFGWQANSEQLVRSFFGAIGDAACNQRNGIQLIVSPRTSSFPSLELVLNASSVVCKHDPIHIRGSLVSVQLNGLLFATHLMAAEWVNKFELSRGHLSILLLLFWPISSFKLPFVVRSHPSSSSAVDSARPISKIVRNFYECILRTRRLIACLARSHSAPGAAFRRTRNRTQEVKRGDISWRSFAHTQFSHWKSITFTTLIFNHLSFLCAPTTRDAIYSPFELRAANAIHIQKLYRVALWGWLIES